MTDAVHHAVPGRRLGKKSRGDFPLLSVLAIVGVFSFVGVVLLGAF